MSLEYPVGTIVIHKSNRSVKFVVASSENINKILIRRVDVSSYVSEFVVDHRELQKIND